MQVSRLRLALVVSATLNLFALGVIGGAAWTWSHRAGRPPAGHGRPILSAADRLPPADAARFRSTLHATLTAARPLQREARESRALAAALFVAPTFDAPAVTSALDHARQADVALRTDLEAAVVRFAQTLSPAERTLLAQGLARRGPLRHPSSERLNTSDPQPSSSEAGE